MINSKVNSRLVDTVIIRTKRYYMPKRTIFFEVDEVYSGILQAFNERKIGAEMVIIFLSKYFIYTLRSFFLKY